MLGTLADVLADAAPLLRWGAVQVGRHGSRLCLMAVPPGRPLPGPVLWHWQRQARLALPGAGVLRLQRDPWGDVDLAQLPAVLQLRWRSGGERIQAGGLRRDVKALLREAQWPAWQRDAVPLLCADTDVMSPVLAVADLIVADTIAATKASTDRGRFIWQQD